MAERTPSSFVPVPDSGQPPVERAPDTQAEGAPAVPVPANNPEQVTERANAHHEKPSGKHADQKSFPLPSRVAVRAVDFF